MRFAVAGSSPVRTAKTRKVMKLLNFITFFYFLFYNAIFKHAKPVDQHWYYYHKQEKAGITFLLFEYSH